MAKVRLPALGLVFPEPGGLLSLGMVDWGRVGDVLGLYPSNPEENAKLGGGWRRVSENQGDF